MARYLWKGRVKDGQRAEYIRRHAEIWPDMLAELERAGIRNYSIWLNVQDELTGYYETDHLETTLRIQAESAVVKRWEAHMEDILEFTGAVEEEVFYFCP